MNIILKSLVAVSMLGALSLSANEYSLDKDHSSVGFKVKHLLITNVKGEFKDFKAKIDFDAMKNSFSKLSTTIKSSSVDTGIEKRDNHLRGEDFFTSKKFPEITFVMSSYKANGDEGIASGMLTIKGVSKKVDLEVEEIATAKDFKGKNRVGFTLKGKINRTDFGLVWNKKIELGGVAVSEIVKLNAEIEAVEVSSMMKKDMTHKDKMMKKEKM